MAETPTGAVARTIATHAIWDIGGVVSRADGLDFAYAFNRRLTTAEHDGTKGQIDGFLDAHGSRL